MMPSSSYRHSLFLPDGQTAEAAMQLVEGHFQLIDGFLTNDGSSRDIEYRFWTMQPLSNFDQGWLLRKTGASSRTTVFNSYEDYEKRKDG